MAAYLERLGLPGANMFAGHIGVALAAARVEPRVNVGVFAAASLLPDLLLWLFIPGGGRSLP